MFTVILIAMTTPYRSDDCVLVSTSSVGLGDQEYVSEEEYVNNHLQVSKGKTINSSSTLRIHEQVRGRYMYMYMYYGDHDVCTHTLYV